MAARDGADAPRVSNGEGKVAAQPRESAVSTAVPPTETEFSLSIPMTPSAQADAATGLEQRSATQDRSAFSRWCGPLGAGSLRGAVIALASTAFGSGVLSLPWVFATLGLPLGALVLVGSGMISWLSQVLLANAAYATRLDNYQDIVRRALGRKATASLDAIIFVYAFGSCVGYFVFISQFGPPLLRSLGVSGWITTPSHQVLGLACFPLIPLCLLRTLSALRYASLLNVASLVVVAVMIISETPNRLSELTDPTHASGAALPDGWWWRPHLSSWEDVPRAVAICFYSYCCHVNLFQKYRELDAPTPRRVNKVLVNAVVLQIVVYFAVGVCGFMSFGLPCAEEVPKESDPSCTPINILASPRFDGWSSIVARVAMIIALVVCIPVNLIAGRAIPLRLLGADVLLETNARDATYARMGATSAFAWHVVLSLAFLFGVAVLAVVYANITSILGILGGGCAVSFMFTIPVAATTLMYFAGVPAPSLPGSPVTAMSPRDWLGDRAPTGTPQMGRFFGVTRAGVILALAVIIPAIVLGYTSAGVAVVSIAQSR